MEACVTFSGDQTSGFFLREAVGYVCVVGFVRQRLDVHKSEKLSHGLLGCWILTQHRAMVAARCHGV